MADERLNSLMFLNTEKNLTDFCTINIVKILYDKIEKLLHVYIYFYWC